MILKSLGLAALMGFAVAACGDDDPIQAIDRATDCPMICEAYATCIGGDSYDTDDCSDRCEDMDSDVESDQISKCEDCLDGRSCTGSVFNCTTECAGIVP